MGNAASLQVDDDAVLGPLPLVSKDFARVLGGLFFAVKTDLWESWLAGPAVQTIPCVPNTYRLQIQDGLVVVTLVTKQDLQEFSEAYHSPLPPCLNEDVILQVLHFLNSAEEVPFETANKENESPPRQVETIDSTLDEEQRKPWFAWLSALFARRHDEDNDDEYEMINTPNKIADNTIDKIADPGELPELVVESAPRLGPRYSPKVSESHLRSRRLSVKTPIPQVPDIKHDDEPVLLPKPAGNGSGSNGVSVEVEAPEWIEQFVEEVEEGTSPSVDSAAETQKKRRLEAPAAWQNFQLDSDDSEVESPTAPTTAWQRASPNVKRSTRGSRKTEADSAKQSTRSPVPTSQTRRTKRSTKGTESVRRSERRKSRRVVEEED